MFSKLWRDPRSHALIYLSASGTLRATGWSSEAALSYRVNRVLVQSGPAGLRSWRRWRPLGSRPAAVFQEPVGDQRFVRWQFLQHQRRRSRLPPEEESAGSNRTQAAAGVSLRVPVWRIFRQSVRLLEDGCSRWKLGARQEPHCLYFLDENRFKRGKQMTSSLSMHLWKVSGAFAKTINQGKLCTLDQSQPSAGQ